MKKQKNAENINIETFRKRNINNGIWTEWRKNRIEEQIKIIFIILKKIYIQNGKNEELKKKNKTIFIIVKNIYIQNGKNEEFKKN